MLILQIGSKIIDKKLESSNREKRVTSDGK